MLKKYLKWILYLVILVVGGIVGINVSIENPYLYETLRLDKSLVVDALAHKDKIVYSEFDLYDAELTERIHSFIVSYSSVNPYSSEALLTLKREVEALMLPLSRYIRNLNGKKLEKKDKHYYLTLYRLRGIDREIVQKLLANKVEAVPFFQKIQYFPTGAGEWVLEIQRPEQNTYLGRYYNMVNSSDFMPKLISRVNELFAFDETHTITFFECGNTSLPVYDRKDKNINICYEQLELVDKLFQNEFKTENEISALIMDIISMVLLRELGRSFLDIYDIAYSGKIEDTIDQLAVVLIAEVFEFSWDEIQTTVMAYAKALFRIHELIEVKGENSLLAGQETLVTPLELESQSILLLNSTYDSAPLLGKQRFYHNLCMLIGYQSELYSPYIVLNESDREVNKVFLDWDPECTRNYLRASNYWYNSMQPYFNLSKRKEK